MENMTTRMEHQEMTTEATRASLAFGKNVK